MKNTKRLKPGEYDSKLMSDLMLSAKGPHRTGAKFCEECGISTATFSRFINGHNVKPCTKEFLRKIAEHAAPDSGVTFERLLAANGGEGSLGNDSMPPLSDNEAIGLITASILKHHYQCQRSDDQENTNILGLSYHPSWSVNTTAINGKTIKKWDFLFWKQYSKSENIEADRMTRQLLIIISAVSLGYLVFDRLTFVFTNPVLYQVIVDRVKDLQLDVDISLLLIDLTQRELKEEYFIHCKTGTQTSLLTIDSEFPQSESTLLSIDEHNLM